MNRWMALAAFSLARFTIGVTLQSIAALAVPLMARTGMGWGEIGMLMGAFLAPGVLASLAGGWVGARFGEKRTVLAGLGVMTLSGGAIAVLSGFEALVVARLALGAGGVGVNVMVTKMVADRFPPSDLPIAFGILGASWPLGLAVTMIALPPTAAELGLREALLAVALLPALVALCVAPVSEPFGGVAGAGGARLQRHELAGVLLAGLAWGLYNVPAVIVMTFGPDLFVARGWEPLAAAGVVSVFAWTAILTVAIGGWATKAIGGRRRAVAFSVASTIPTSIWLLLDLPGATTPGFLALMVALAGFGGGALMSMPALATRPETRAVGMGVFFALFYALMALGAAAAGWLREATADPEAPFALMVALNVALALSVLAFERKLAAPTPDVAPTADKRS